MTRPRHFPQQVRDLQAWTRRWPTHPASRRIRSARRRPRSGCSAVRTTARSWPRISGCRMRSPISSPTARASSEAIDLYRQPLPAERAPPEAAGDDLRLGAGRRHATRRPRIHALSRERWRVDRARGVFGPLQAPDDIAAQRFLVGRDGDRRSRCARALSSARRRDVADQMRRLAAHSSSTRSSSTPGRMTPRCGGVRTRCWRASSGFRIVSPSTAAR